MVEDFLLDFDNHLEILDFSPNPLDFTSDSPLQNFLIIKTKATGKFTPLTIEIQGKTVAKDGPSGEAICVTEAMKEERKKHLDKVNEIIAEKLKRRGRETLNFLDSNRNSPTCVRRFLKKLLRLPKEKKKAVEDKEEETKASESTL